VATKSTKAVAEATLADYGTVLLFLRQVTLELGRGNHVSLKGIGILRPADVKPRYIESPMLPGGRAFVPAHRSVRFRQAHSAKRALNPGLYGHDGGVIKE